MNLREEELLKKLAERDAENAELRREIALLRQKIDLLVKRIFGSSSEKLDPKQLELLLGKDDASSEKGEASSTASLLVLPSPEPEPEKRTARKPRPHRIPENLPCIDQIIDPDEVKATPWQWRCIGEEISERLDYEPARFLRRRVIRRKYAHRKDPDAVLAIAPLPPALQERCLAAPGLLAQIIVPKFADHLPLYRQEQIYRSRHGVEIPRQTMARWLGLCADWLRLVYQEISARVVAGPYVQIDETPIEYLAPGHGATKLGYLWVCNQPGAGGQVAFHWHTSRAAACLGKIIPHDFRGVIQCDGYAGYRSFANERGGHIQLAACYAHVRRKFYEAREQAPQVAGWLLRQIGHLYRIEDRLRTGRAGPKLRQAVRTSQSRMIHERIHRSLLRLKMRRRYLPKSGMGIAIDYALGLWSSLGVYLENGRVEMCNNLVENAIRPTALGKKNWLFIGDGETGERSAILYTLVENCRRLGIDPYAYLRDILAKLPTLTNRQIKDVTPVAYAQAMQRTQLAAAS